MSETRKSTQQYVHELKKDLNFSRDIPTADQLARIAVIGVLIDPTIRVEKDYIPWLTVLNRMLSYSFKLSSITIYSQKGFIKSLRDIVVLVIDLEKMLIEKELNLFGISTDEQLIMLANVRYILEYIKVGISEVEWLQDYFSTLLNDLET